MGSAYDGAEVKLRRAGMQDTLVSFFHWVLSSSGSGWQQTYLEGWLHIKECVGVLGVFQRWVQQPSNAFLHSDCKFFIKRWSLFSSFWTCASLWLALINRTQLKWWCLTFGPVSWEPLKLPLFLLSRKPTLSKPWLSCSRGRVETGSGGREGTWRKTKFPATSSTVCQSHPWDHYWPSSPAGPPATCKPRWNQQRKRPAKSQNHKR